VDVQLALVVAGENIGTGGAGFAGGQDVGDFAHDNSFHVWVLIRMRLHRMRCLD
jgi:hypothetical protein